MIEQSTVSKSGFEYSATPEYIDKLKELDAMRSEFRNLKVKGAALQRQIRDFLETYANFMSRDNYQASNPTIFLASADKIIAEGRALLASIPQ